MVFLDIPWQEIWNDIIDVLLYIPRRVWELLLQGLSNLVNAIPAPDFFTSVGGLFGNLPAGFSWAFYLFNLSAGIGIILSAYILRFLIRRIPVVG